MVRRRQCRRGVRPRGAYAGAGVEAASWPRGTGAGARGLPRPKGGGGEGARADELATGEGSMRRRQGRGEAVRRSARRAPKGEARWRLEGRFGRGTRGLEVGQAEARANSRFIVRGAFLKVESEPPIKWDGFLGYHST